MTLGRLTGRRRPAAAAPRVGLFGILGAGNIGNDAQLEVMLAYLRRNHPDAVLDAMCTGPERLTAEYGMPAIPLFSRNERQTWQGRARQGRAGDDSSRLAWPGATAIAERSRAMVVEAFRTASWVRRHDVVIVPGAGVLETSMPLRPWETPYAVFLLCAFGRLFGTKVALVNVGADVINQPLTRRLLLSAARLAFYRSYRDTGSLNAMRQQGFDTTQDQIYRDLVFGMPAPPCEPGDVQTVGVGLMAYYGTNDDRGRAEELATSYLNTMKAFLRWLVDNGRRIRLFVGDTNGCDDSVVHEVLADLRTHRPELDPTWVVAEPASSFAELMRAMAPVGSVVATRYHNVMCALKLAKPTISIGYSMKHDCLMTDMGVSEFCQRADSVSLDRLIEQFTRLESRTAQLRQTLTERNVENGRILDEQFAELSDVLFGAGARQTRAAATHERPLERVQPRPIPERTQLLKVASRILLLLLVVQGLSRGRPVRP